MTYRWEPTTPLDRILEAGFKRIDEAVEGVIDRLAPSEPYITVYLKDEDLYNSILKEAQEFVDKHDFYDSNGNKLQ